MRGKHLFQFAMVIGGVSVALTAFSLPAVAASPVPNVTCEVLIGPEKFAQAQASLDAYNADRIARVRSGEISVTNAQTGDGAITVDSSNVDQYIDYLTVPIDGVDVMGIYTCGGAGPIAVGGSSNWVYDNVSAANMTEAEFVSYIESFYGVPAPTDPSSITTVTFITNTQYVSWRDGVFFRSTSRDWLASAINAVETGNTSGAAADGGTSNTPSSIGPSAESDNTASAQDVTGANSSDPSVLSTLPTLFDLRYTLGSVGAVAGGSIVFAALIAIPTWLIQRVVRGRYDDWMSRARSRTTRLASLWTAVVDRVRIMPTWVTVASGVLLTAVITGFVSPSFGVNGQSARLVASVALGIALESLVLLGILVWIITHRGGRARIELRLGSLGIVVLTVLFTRLTNFQPGIVFGLVLALIVVTTSDRVTDVGIDIAEVLLAVALGLVAWLGYSAMYVLAPEPNTISLLVQETLAAVVLGTLTALPLALLPLGNLPGRAMMKARFGVWSALMFTSLILFFGIVMPFPESIEKVEWPLVGWTIFFVGYAVVGVGVWVVDQVVRSRASKLTPRP